MTEAGDSISAAFSGRLGGFSLDVAFTAPMRGVTALFGPSGSGKTTILRCVAGLTRLAGRLAVGGDTWQDTGGQNTGGRHRGGWHGGGSFRPPHRRPVGYVFQEASLFPHLSVRRNLLYGWTRAGAAPAGAVGLDGIVELLGIGALLDRAPSGLSGGERQRVAIGRALLSRPRLLLMDEPLAGLDHTAKDEILPYLEALHEALAIPVLYVSHDIAEVERLADTLVLLDGGRVLASGALGALEADTRLPLVRAPEAAVTLDGRIAAIDQTYALTTFAVAGGTLVVPGRRGSVGSSRRLRVRASDVSFALSRPTDTTILNCLAARILSMTPQDRDETQVNVVVALGADGAGDRIVGRITRKSWEALGLAPGAPVFAQIKSVALVASGAGLTGTPRARERLS